MRERVYYVYIMTNKRNNVLYTGVTNDLERRVFEHKNNLVKGFTSKYHINKLIYCEGFTNIDEAIMCEKQIKGGSRQKKLDLIKKDNSNFTDLVADWY